MKKIFLYGSLISLSVFIFSFLIESCKQSEKKQTASSGGFEFKEKLSEYGFFKNDLKKLDPINGQVIRYELITPLFTDYAVKDRFIVLPKGKQMSYTASGVFDFPDSTIIIKNFAYRDSLHQKIMIETRLLVKDPADHSWKVMDYVWNKEQTDAEKTIIGASVPIKLRDDNDNLISTVYKVPNTNDCKRCHNNNNITTPIGPKARNLNFTLAGQKDNQLAQWASGGWLKELPELNKVQQLPDWKDSIHYSLEQRARAYLDVNCAHCHIKGGDAYNTGLFLNYDETDAFHIGVMKEPVSAGGGAGGLNYDVIPKNYPNSILAYRMNSTEPGTAMPELGRSLVHKEGVRLIQQWISKMKSK
ncbi:MAG TPA: SO2930 family diheme c-type cytochrome [Puia sp.]|nr:SO2930 family diheme c-type cytochrome [Puia sp.]